MVGQGGKDRGGASDIRETKGWWRCLGSEGTTGVSGYLCGRGVGEEYGVPAWVYFYACGTEERQAASWAPGSTLPLVAVLAGMVSLHHMLQITFSTYAEASQDRHHDHYRLLAYHVHPCGLQPAQVSAPCRHQQYRCLSLLLDRHGPHRSRRSPLATLGRCHWPRHLHVPRSKLLRPASLRF